MLKGFAITPPVVGRISIGRVIKKNGKRLPEKDDQFTITTQVQNREGWMLHPFDEALRQKNEGDKLRCIPVRLAFNDPDLNLRAEYSCFDKKAGRPLCIGNGESYRRDGPEGLASYPCPSPDLCEHARRGCKPYGRLNVLIGEGDDLGMFIFRTTSFNSIRTLAARMRYYQAVSGVLACLPLELKLRGKSTTQSHRSAIYYVDLVIPANATPENAIKEARRLDSQRKEAGFDQAALDEASRIGFSNGAFEESGEDVPAVVEEFFPEQTPVGQECTSDEADKAVTEKMEKTEKPLANESGLSSKLKAKAERMAG
jgi:hypothetical protein